MVKLKGRKKPFPGSSAARRADSQASEDAPDNPGTIPEVERLSSIRDDPIALRRSPRLCLMEAGIVRNNSKQNTNEFVLTGSAGNSTREPNDVEWHHNDGARSADALTGAPTLAPIGTHNQEQLSPVNKSTRSRSPSIDGNAIGSDQEDRRVQRLLELEIEIQEAKEHLRNAQDELAQESSKDSSQSISGSNRSCNRPIQDGKEVRHSRVSDENIHQAVHDLHDHSQHDGEMQEAFQARKNASAHIRRNSEAVENIPQPEVIPRDDILDNLLQLYAEQEEYDTEQIRRNKDGENARRSSKRQRDISLMGKEVRRREHYREWLTTQNVLNSMRHSDIRAMGYSNIPSRDKRATYGGYPKSNYSENHDRNATPGPSHPYNRKHDNHNHDYDHDRSNSRTNTTPLHKRRQDNDPDDPDDSSSTDGTYRPSRSSRDETSDLYPSSKTEDRDRH